MGIWCANAAHESSVVSTTVNAQSFVDEDVDLEVIAFISVEVCTNAPVLEPVILSDRLTRVRILMTLCPACFQSERHHAQLR